MATLPCFALATCIWNWYAPDNNVRATPRGIRKNPNAGRSPTARLSTADVNSHMPCCAHAEPLPCCAVVLRSRFQNGIVGARHGHGMGTE